MTKPIRFSFHNTPTGLRMRNAHPIQSTRALSGMNRVFTRLEQINKAAYEKVRHLDEFSVNLEKQPGSEKYGMRIFAEKVQIHIPNLKPETQKIFLELPPLPSAPPAPLSPDMMSSMGTTVFPQNLLVSFATALSAFWNWIKSLHGNEPKKVSFAPDTLDKPSSRLEPKRRTENPPAADSSPSTTTISTRLPVIMLDQEPEAPMMEETLDILLPPSEMDRNSESDGEIYPENREYVDPASQKGQPLERMLQTPDAPLKHYSQPVLEPLPEPLHPDDFASDKELPSKNMEPSIPERPSTPLEYEKLHLPSSTRPKHHGCVILEQEATKTPAAPAAPQEMQMPPVKKKTEIASPIPDESIFTPSEISESEKQLLLFKSIFMVKLSTEITDAQKTTHLFGEYFLERILSMNDLQSCEMDKDTGIFTLTFAEEKLIRLKNLPPVNKLNEEIKLLLGTTLHIGKKVSGKIDLKTDEGVIEFDENSLTIQGTVWKKLKSWLPAIPFPLNASLVGIKIYPKNKQYLTFTGKQSITADRTILAQDFINFIECNITK